MNDDEKMERALNVYDKLNEFHDNLVTKFIYGLSIVAIIAVPSFINKKFQFNAAQEILVRFYLILTSINIILLILSTFLSNVASFKNCEKRLDVCSHKVFNWFIKFFNGFYTFGTIADIILLCFIILTLL